MLACMRRASVLLVGLLGLLGAGCATTLPPQPRAAIRDATNEERAAIGRLLVPLLITSGIWARPADGCATALGILPSAAINLSVGPNSNCKFSLVITEEAYKVLPADELRAALAHEIGHVQLGHFTARKERRAAEKKARGEIQDKATTAGAVVQAVVGLAQHSPEAIRSAERRTGGLPWLRGATLTRLSGITGSGGVDGQPASL
jgi:hypothetical protein